MSNSLFRTCILCAVAGGFCADVTAQVKANPGEQDALQPVRVVELPRGTGLFQDRLLTTEELPSDATLRKVEIPEAVLESVVQLGDSKWAMRDAAERNLFEMNVGVEVFLAVLLREELGLEQRARLVSIASRRISEAPRGAVGIRMRRGVGIEAGVVVEAVIEGLPGEKFMKAGDRITGIDGIAVVTSEDLTSIVQSRIPGQQITVDVVRKLVDERGVTIVGNDGRPKTEEIRLEFPLGSVKQLDSRGGVSSSSRVLAVRARVVDAIQLRFAPRSVRLRTRAVIEQERAYENRSPDTHPSVQWLKRRLDLVDAGLDSMDDKMRRSIRENLGILVQEAGDSGARSFAERAWLQRVIARYIELAPPN